VRDESAGQAAEGRALRRCEGEGKCSAVVVAIAAAVAMAMGENASKVENAKLRE
jgi:hypothetical protein